MKSSNKFFNKYINKSFLITFITIVIGILFVVLGVYLFGTSSDKVVDNVLSGETATSSVFLIILGFIILAISFFINFSSKNSLGKTFDNIKNIEETDDFSDSKKSDISTNPKLILLILTIL